MKPGLNIGAKALKPSTVCIIVAAVIFLLILHSTAPLYSNDIDDSTTLIDSNTTVYTPPLPPMHLINYGTEGYETLQRTSCETGLQVAKFESCTSYRKENISEIYLTDLKRQFDTKYGGGLGVWKPYIIFEKLYSIPCGAYVFYADSDLYFVSSIEPWTQKMLDYNVEILLFEPTVKRIEKYWTKRDALKALGAVNETDVLNTPQFMASLSIWRHTPSSLSFLRDWMRLSTDYDAISTKPSRSGPEIAGFQHSRREQSLMSVYAKQHRRTFGHQTVQVWPWSDIHPSVIELTKR